MVPDENIYRHVHGALGDTLCFFSAIRKLARFKQQTLRVYTQRRNLLGLFADDLLKYGDEILLPKHKIVFNIHPREDFDIDENRSVPATEYCKNFVGVFMKAFHMDVGEAPTIEVPDLPRLPRLPRQYIAFQPFSNFAPNPPIEFLNRVVERARRVLPIVLVGSPDTPAFPGTDNTFLGDEMSLLSTIQHAALVLCPRSASAHAASGYRTSACVWLPPRCKYNWHLNYPNWPSRRGDFDQLDWFETVLDPMLKEISANG